MGNLTYNRETEMFQLVNFTREESRQAIEAGFVVRGSTLLETRNVHKARKLWSLADSYADKILKNTFIVEFERPEQIIYPDHLTPKVSQLESTWHMLTRSRSLNADEAGLGKTASAIMCINTVPGKTLIICPAYLKYNWKKELETWLTTKQEIVILEKTKVTQKVYDDVREAHTIICPDSLIRFSDVRRLLSVHLLFDWCFVDESHRFNKDETKRTDALRAICSRVDRLVLLTGTPAPNGNIEYFGLSNAFASEVLGGISYEAFARRFCEGRLRTIRQRGRPSKQVLDVSGCSNEGELSRLLTDKFMVRHFKKDVLKDLKDKTRRMIYLDSPKSLLPFERLALKTLPRLNEMLGEEKEDFNLGDVARFRRECGIAKVKASLEYLSDQIKYGDKPVIIFAHHKEVVTALKVALKEFKPFVINGDVKIKDRQVIVEQFQELGHKRPLIGNIDAMGTGLTLTRSNKVIFVEYSWVFGVNEQAEDRTWRIGQDDFVDIIYLVFRDSIDENILTANFRKKQTTEAVLGKSNYDKQRSKHHEHTINIHSRKPNSRTVKSNHEHSSR